jgi:hypothetical protein
VRDLGRNPPVSAFPRVWSVVLRRNPGAPAGAGASFGAAAGAGLATLAFGLLGPGLSLGGADEAFAAGWRWARTFSPLPAGSFTGAFFLAAVGAFFGTGAFGAAAFLLEAADALFAGTFCFAMPLEAACLPRVAGTFAFPAAPAAGFFAAAFFAGPGAFLSFPAAFLPAAFESRAPAFVGRPAFGLASRDAGTFLAMPLDAAGFGEAFARPRLLAGMSRTEQTGSNFRFEPRFKWQSGREDRDHSLAPNH